MHLIYIRSSANDSGRSYSKVNQIHIQKLFKWDHIDL